MFWSNKTGGKWITTAILACLPAMPWAAETNGVQESSSNGQAVLIDQAQDANLLTLENDARFDKRIKSYVTQQEGTSLITVIRTLGRQHGINFMFNPGDIEGDIVLELRDVSLRDALQSILTTRKLALVPDRGGIYRIVPESQVGRSGPEVKTEVIQLNWVSAVDVKNTLQAFTTDNIGKIEFNEESNVLIITDVPPQLATLKELIAEIDKPERQVEIEARLIDINIGALRDLGTEWSASRANTDYDKVLNEAIELEGDGIPVIAQGLSVIDLVPNPGMLSSVGQEGAYFDGSQGAIQFGDVINVFGNEYSFAAAMTALETRGIAELLANPRVTTLNNVPALIQILERIPYLDEVGQGNESEVEIEFEESGIEINVKPIVTPNGFVRMEVELTQKIFRERIGDYALAPPRIDERNAETNIIVGSGNTVALGGLRQVRSIESLNAVPFLHQIPLLGWLFKTKSNNQDKTELLLMVKPTVIENDILLSDREKQLYDRIDTRWHVPDHFFDDVEGPEILY